MRAPATLESLGLLRLHHIGIAVADLDAAIDRAGGVVEVRAELPDQGVVAAAVRVGASELEFVTPLGESPAIRRFLERRGDGLHHLAWEVADVGDTLARAAAAGLRLIDTEPRTGLHGVPIAFLHPSAAGGVLTELVQQTPAHT